MMLPGAPLPPFDPRWDVENRGRWGERAVARHLWRQGWRIVGHRIRIESGSDIDLVAANDAFLLFCEVKVRTSGKGGADPWLEIDDPGRRKNLCQAVSVYLRQTGQTLAAIRFDAFVVRPEAANPRQPHIDVRENYIDPSDVQGWKGALIQ
jgi:Holliday junction resolvase-like predicted endonuclease